MKIPVSILTTVISISLFFFISSSYAKLYVSDGGTNAVVVFNETDDGNVSPLQNIAGANTGMLTPTGIAVDEKYIYVAQYSSNAVTVYDQNADGNISPVRAITGASTLLSRPIGLAIDSNYIYVVNMENASSADLYLSITVYNLTDNGNIEPVRTISGEQTNLGTAGHGGPGGIAVDANYIYVVRPAIDAVLVYNINADGDVAPVRIIAGNLTGMAVPYGVDVNENFIYVANLDSAVTVYGLTADGNVSPATTITGDQTGLANSQGIAVDSEYIYVANGAGGNVPLFNLADKGNIAPVRSITNISIAQKIAVFAAQSNPPAKWNLFLPAILQSQRQ